MYEYHCKIVKIVDGDTVDVDIDLGFGVWLKKERVRVNGIDTPETEQLLAANHNVDAMCSFIGADSLGFLSLDGLYKAMGFPDGRDDLNPQFTDHCFTGDYPTDLKDYRDENLQEQLSLLSDNEDNN